MGKFFKKIKAGFEDAIAYQQGKITLRTEVIEIPPAVARCAKAWCHAEVKKTKPDSHQPIVAEKPMRTKRFQKYIEKRFTKEELAKILQKKKDELGIIIADTKDFAQKITKLPKPQIELLLLEQEKIKVQNEKEIGGLQQMIDLHLRIEASNKVVRSEVVT